MTKDELIAFEQKCVEAWKDKRIKVPCHLSGGNEYTLLRIFENIRPIDWVVSTHRNHYHYLLKGGNGYELFKEIIGEDGGLCSGRSGSMHTTDLPRRFISSCLVGCGAPVATGIALGIKRRGGLERVWCFLGDGALDEGMVWESIMYSEGMKLPVTFVVECNDRSVCSSEKDRGVEESYTRHMVQYSPNVLMYHFRPTFPHVADGSFVSF
jgi:TPP-dependent pyruvate/acetoin dehydrogenase alpha subunit